MVGGHKSLCMNHFCGSGAEYLFRGIVCVNVVTQIALDDFWPKGGVRHVDEKKFLGDEDTFRYSCEHDHRILAVNNVVKLFYSVYS